MQIHPIKEQQFLNAIVWKLREEKLDIEKLVSQIAVHQHLPFTTTADKRAVWDSVALALLQQLQSLTPNPGHAEAQLNDRVKTLEAENARLRNLARPNTGPASGQKSLFDIFGSATPRSTAPITPKAPPNEPATPATGRQAPSTPHLPVAPPCTFKHTFGCNGREEVLGKANPPSTALPTSKHGQPH